MNNFFFELCLKFTDQQIGNLSLDLILLAQKPGMVLSQTGDNSDNFKCLITVLLSVVKQELNGLVFFAILNENGTGLRWFESQGNF